MDLPASLAIWSGFSGYCKITGIRVLFSTGIGKGGGSCTPTDRVGAGHAAINTTPMQVKNGGMASTWLTTHQPATLGLKGAPTPRATHPGFTGLSLVRVRAMQSSWPGS